MANFTRMGNTFRVAPKHSLDIQPTLPPGNYTIAQDDHGMFLVMTESFVSPPKIYGDVLKNTDRILRTFADRPHGTGVMLEGEKGSGKTLLAKNIAIEGAKVGIPTIIVNAPWCGDGFNKFIQAIEQPTIILFDEFEKIYDDETQEKVLTLFDGVWPSKKLYIVTCNDKYKIDNHMHNRPGRMFYSISYSGLSLDFIREYAEDQLDNKSHVDKLCDLTSLFEEFNFDMLKALVEEMNRYKETPQEAMKLLNTRPNDGRDVNYTIEDFRVNGEKVSSRPAIGGTLRISPIDGGFSVYYNLEIEAEQEFEDTANATPTTALRQLLVQKNTPSTLFFPKDIKKLDSKSGILQYTNDDGAFISLKEVPPAREFSYMDL